MKIKNFKKFLVTLFITVFIITIAVAFGYMRFINKAENKNLLTSNVEKNSEAVKKPEEKESTDIKPMEVIKPSIIEKVKVSEIPVLMYHSVLYEKGNDVRVAPEKFEEQMKFLKDNGYNTLSLEEFYDFQNSGADVPKKPIVLTFDDGYVDNYITVLPILKKYGFKATVFMITSTVDTDKNFLTSSQLKEMDANGFRVESHTVNHEKLATISFTERLATLKNSKAFLEKLLNREVKFLAYPFGNYDDSTIKSTKEAGYTLAITTDSGWSKSKGGDFNVKRVFISGSASIEVFKDRITNPNYKTN